MIDIKKVMIVVQLIKKLPKVLYLFLGIISFIFIFPLLDNASVLDIFGPMSYSVILLSIVSIIEKKNLKRMLWLYLLVLISFILIWLQYFIHGIYFSVISFLFNISVFMSATIIMIYQIVKSEKVTAQLVIETVSAYLLIGIMFSLSTALLYSFNHESFNISNGSFSDFVYFSFVSLTTIGYGDISPQTDFARSVTIFFGLFGQLYLTIVMALIIGKYLNKNK